MINKIAKLLKSWLIQKTATTTTLLSNVVKVVTLLLVVPLLPNTDYVAGYFC